MKASVTHFEILGPKGGADRLQKFYSELFEWKVDANNPMSYGMIEKQGDGIGGGIGESFDETTWVTVYVEVDNVRAALDRAVELGATIVNEPMQPEGGPLMAHFRDPDGNMIGIMEAM